MVPKIAHFYWGEKTLPYLRYLTLATFARYNPSWTMKLYIPNRRSSIRPWPSHEQKYTVTGPDYFSKVAELPVKVIRFEGLGLGIPDDISEVHKSDILRWHLLATEGGLWSDMDIVYFKPVPELPYDAGLCINPKYGHSIGFVYSRPDNPLFASIYHMAKAGYSPDNYQSSGAVIMCRHYPSIKFVENIFKTISVFNIPMDWVYAYDATMIHEIFAPVNRKERFTKNSLGVHWFAGAKIAGEYINKITHENYCDTNNVLCRAIRKALK